MKRTVLSVVGVVSLLAVTVFGGSACSYSDEVESRTRNAALVSASGDDRSDIDGLADREAIGSAALSADVSDLSVVALMARNPEALRLFNYLNRLDLLDLICRVDRIKEIPDSEIIWHVDRRYELYELDVIVKLARDMGTELIDCSEDFDSVSVSEARELDLHDLGHYRAWHNPPFASFRQNLDLFDLLDRLDLLHLLCGIHQERFKEISERDLSRIRVARSLTGDYWTSLILTREDRYANRGQLLQLYLAVNKSRAKGVDPTLGHC